MRDKWREQPSLRMRGRWKGSSGIWGGERQVSGRFRVRGVGLIGKI